MIWLRMHATTGDFALHLSLIFDLSYLIAGFHLALSLLGFLPYARSWLFLRAA